jgi:hypothetical protein
MDASMTPGRMLRLPGTNRADSRTVRASARTERARVPGSSSRKVRYEMAQIALPEPVRRFVATTNTHDADALFDVFAPGATVVDDGTTYNTEDALREWIRVHQIDPRIVVTPVSFVGDRLVGSVNGEFSGGPLTFAFTFTVEDDAITNLTIAPA